MAKLQLFVVSACLLLAAVVPRVEAFNFDFHVGACQETCCCPVCSSSSSESFPYGLLNEPPWNNPVSPNVVGSSCHVSVWSDRSVKDLTGSPVSPPATLWWQDVNVFGDDITHRAPISCDCCILSIPTSCAENAPIATAPTQFRVGTGIAIAHTPANLVFENGVALSSNDYVELRNDTHCGYPAPLLQSAAGVLTTSPDYTESEWYIATLPHPGCYKVCYYQSNLTTTGWYELGDLTVYPAPQPVPTFRVDPADVVLEGNTVTITYHGQDLLNVFDDQAELRSAGVCGAASPTTSTSLGTNGKLEVLPGADWCHPPVTPKISTYRPLQYIPVQYSDCNTWHRNYLDRLTWQLVLPAAATYTMCYRLNGTTNWLTLGTLTVPAQNTQLAALTALYAATGGGQWTRQTGWDSGNECLFHGIRCDSSNNVVGIFLGRNNLQGTLPQAFFLSAFFNTLVDLKLDDNAITGDLPHEIGAFRQLKMLNLELNQLTGNVPPSLIRTQVQGIYLSENSFDGEVPKHVTELSQRFVQQTALAPYTEPTPYNACPGDTLICSDRGSTDVGVSQCGHSGITELECLVRGCCFNAQAPLTFGGTACFTKKANDYSTYPPCKLGTFTCTPQFTST